MEWTCEYDLDLQHFDPKIYRCLPFLVVHLCMKYQVFKRKAQNSSAYGITTKRGRKCQYDLDLKIYRCLPFLNLHLCMKYEASRMKTSYHIMRHYNKVLTDGQTDKVITIGHPHLQWWALIMCNTMNHG